MYDFFLGSQKPVGGKLYFGETAASELASQFGTPLYVFDAQEFRSRIRRLKAAAPDAHIAFASKAISALAVLAIAREEGIAIDVASSGELEAALRAGFSSAQITLHGNNKSDEELERAVALRVGRIVIDNFSEIRRIADIASAQPVMLRLAPGVDPVTHKAISTGQEDTKFGFNIADGSAAEALREVMSRSSLSLVGYHCHVGSQLMDSEAQLAGVRRLCEFAIQNMDISGDIAEINAGGGLGARYLPEHHPENIDNYCRDIIREIEMAFKGTRVPRVGFEPGRWLCAEAGTTLYRAGVIKKVNAKSGARTYIAVDGGLADNPRPQLYDAVYTAMNADRLEEPHDTAFTISGRHCETDLLIEKAMLPKTTAEGDLVAVQTTGAYNQAMASNYNRYPRPAMAIVGEGEPYLCVERETLDDLFRKEKVRDREKSGGGGGN